MMAHLWTKTSEAPFEYLTLVLCRDIYHCVPDELPRQKAITIMRHLNCMKIEMEVEQLRKK